MAPSVRSCSVSGRSSRSTTPRRAGRAWRPDLASAGLGLPTWGHVGVRGWWRAWQRYASRRGLRSTDGWVAKMMTVAELHGWVAASWSQRVRLCASDLEATQVHVSWATKLTRW